MNLKKWNLVLLGAAAVLAIPTWLTLAHERELFVDIAAVPRLFEGFTADNVSGVILALPKPTTAPAPAPNDPTRKPEIQYDSIQFVRGDKGYVLNQAGDLTGAPVNKDMLEAQVFKHLAEIRADKQTLVLAGATDEQLAEYGLNQQKAFVIKAVNASGVQQVTLAELLIGNDTAGGKIDAGSVRGVYVRKGDSRDVIAYEQTINKTIKTDLWIDRTILKAPADKVRKLTLRNQASNGAAIEFTRPEGKGAWTAANPPEGCGAVRQTEVEGLAQRFGWVAVQEFKRRLEGAPLKEFGLDPPQIEVAVTWQDGEEKTATLGFGNKVEGKNEHYLRSSTSGFVMTIGSHMATPFERDPKELFDPKELAPKPDEPGKDGAPKKDETPKKDEKKPGADNDKKPGGDKDDKAKK